FLHFILCFTTRSKLKMASEDDEVVPLEELPQSPITKTLSLQPTNAPSQQPSSRSSESLAFLQQQQDEPPSRQSTSVISDTVESTPPVASANESVSQLLRFSLETFVS